MLANPVNVTPTGTRPREFHTHGDERQWFLIPQPCPPTALTWALLRLFAVRRRGRGGPGGWGRVSSILESVVRAGCLRIRAGTAEIACPLASGSSEKSLGGARRSVRRPQPPAAGASYQRTPGNQPSSAARHPATSSLGTEAIAKRRGTVKGTAGMAQVVSMKQLLESGVHFGHQTRRWNPKMKRYILTERNGIYIIDLQQSLEYIDRAYEFIRETVAHGGTVMYVGTKKQAQEAIAEQARRVGMPYVNQRWLGGMLTNFSTVYKRLQRLKELEEIDFNDVAASGMTKKELLQLRREHDKLERTLGGIRDMSRVPSAIWVVDTKKEHIAVNEARKLGIPVVAILDTNCDPDEVNYPIPGNDDAIRSVALLTRVVADAVAEGLIARAGAANGDEKPSGSQLGTEEPLAEWERELLVGSSGTASEATAGAPAAAGQTPAADGSATSDATPAAGASGTPDTTATSDTTATAGTTATVGTAAPVGTTAATGAGTAADATANGTATPAAEPAAASAAEPATASAVEPATASAAEPATASPTSSAEDPAEAAADTAHADAEARAAAGATDTASAIEAAEDAADE